jgi:[ribosomal protein S5]-alanine N-acetyltransferase
VRALLQRCEVRSFEPGDAASLARHAHNRAIWRSLRDAFPHPYAEADAVPFIARTQSQRPERDFAIVVDGEAIGAVGLKLHDDVERVSAEIGYWLGEEFWGRGLATEVVRAVTQHGVDVLGLTRIYALPFEWNGASCRVLEKAGYLLEARLRRAVIKEGRIIGQFQYAFVVPEG